jgi:hypothetical protein
LEKRYAILLPVCGTKVLLDFFQKIVEFERGKAPFAYFSGEQKTAVSIEAAEKFGRDKGTRTHDLCDVNAAL